MRKGNDNRVKMLYHLENNTLCKGAVFSSTETLQSYVDFITASAFWRAAVEYPGVPGSVKVFSNGDRDFSEQAYPNEIWLALSHWNQQVVLHELAHFFEDSHSPKYIRAYLNLIAAFMGTEVAKQYRQAFKLGGIKS